MVWHIYKQLFHRDLLLQTNMKNTNSTSLWGYSIIAAVLMVWFLLILTTSTLNLVLQEMQDGRWRQWYLSAYAGAEWALELALLDIKKQGYWYDDDSFFENEMLGSWSKYPKISYEFNSNVTSYTASLNPLWIDIIPLFSIWDSGISPVDAIDFQNSDESIVWNIVTQSWWVSGKGSFTSETIVWEKTLWSGNEFVLSGGQKIKDILSWEDYLVLQKLETTGSSDYTLNWAWGGFTLPRAEVFSSAKVWKYKQNLKTIVDNTEFLWILRYSVYSGD